MKPISIFTCIAFLLLSVSCKEKTTVPPTTSTGIATRDPHLALGNPSNAIKDINQKDNYLIEKLQFALSYNNAKGTANWVAWHLSTAWKGPAARQDDFRGDPDLPNGFFKASSSSYSGSGFDRGHLCPSDDRDSSIADNSATFVMTNMIPQSPNLNRITWLGFEDYCRTMMNRGNELYIFAGGYGQGGEGSNGTANTIASGKINVPSHCWKIAVILPVGTDDLNRIDGNTRIIAIDMPNTQSVNDQFWGDYRVSIDFLEGITGFDFLSKVNIGLQTQIEGKVDNGTTN